MGHGLSDFGTVTLSSELDWLIGYGNGLGSVRWDGDEVQLFDGTISVEWAWIHDSSGWAAWCRAGESVPNKSVVRESERIAG